ncbi:MAG: DUF2490 domain-containing protein [Flavobacteriales bacterium]|nr:DUF2490 domain-containing protein [Flavobacteriales bacterium]
MLVCLCWISAPIVAQEAYQLGTLPSVNMNSKLKNDWSVNLKVETRQIYQRGYFSGESLREFNYQLSDFTFTGAKKVGFYGRVGVGYLFRIREGEIVHRVNQQYNYTKQYNWTRLSHRVLTDQTFFANEAPDFRLRYRISSQTPLNGQSLEQKEWYAKVNNEYVNNWQNANYNLEIRLIPMLGYTITTQNKVEFGIDYRLNSVMTEAINHRFWLALNWYLEI